MAKKQSRRSISVRGATYPLARLHAASRGKSLSDWLEFWIARGMESEGAIPPPPARRGGPKPAPRTLTSGAQAAAEIARLGAELAKAQEQIDYLRGALAVEAERFKKAEREYIEADHRTGLMVGDTRRERDAEKVRADREWNAAIEAANSVVGRLSGNNAALVAAGAAIRALARPEQPVASAPAAPQVVQEPPQPAGGGGATENSRSAAEVKVVHERAARETRQCSAPTNNGQPCRGLVLGDVPICASHERQRRQREEAERRAAAPEASPPASVASKAPPALDPFEVARAALPPAPAAPRAPTSALPSRGLRPLNVAPACDVVPTPPFVTPATPAPARSPEVARPAVPPSTHRAPSSGRPRPIEEVVDDATRASRASVRGTMF